MPRYIKVACCRECPYLKWVTVYIGASTNATDVGPITYDYICTKHNNAYVLDILSIPAWCPLEEYGDLHNCVELE